MEGLPARSDPLSASAREVKAWKVVGLRSRLKAPDSQFDSGTLPLRDEVTMMDGILGVIHAVQSIPPQLWLVLAVGLGLYVATQREIVTRRQEPNDVDDDERRALQEMEYELLARDERARKLRRERQSARVVPYPSTPTRNGVDVQRGGLHPLPLRKPGVDGDAA